MGGVDAFLPYIDRIKSRRAREGRRLRFLSLAKRGSYVKSAVELLSLGNDEVDGVLGVVAVFAVVVRGRYQFKPMEQW
jgi:hypothetical protein